MKRVACGALAIVIVAATATAQSPSVEVATIKRAAAVGNAVPNVIWLSGNRMAATGLTLVQLIRSAYEQLVDVLVIDAAKPPTED